MVQRDLPELAAVAEAAADAARREILPRFRAVAVETKKDGSPVTEADRTAELAIRAVLRDATPEIGILGEEYGEEGESEGRRWLVDPIDGTLSFSRGIPLFATLIALLDDGDPIVGLIDCTAFDERLVGYLGGGVRRNGVPVRVSERSDLRSAIVTHGDVYTFDLFGRRPTFDRMAREIPMLRGYSDAFGHAQVIGGNVDAMVDLYLNPWDAAPTQILATEAGGRCVTLPGPVAPNGQKTLGLVFGSPALVDELTGWLSAPDPR